MQGTVKWFDDQKGYGFITGDDGAEIFVHHADIMGQAGHKSLDDGARVEYEAGLGAKGPRAVNVRAVKETSNTEHRTPNGPFLPRLERAVADWERESGSDRALHRVQDLMMWLEKNG